MGGVLTIQKRSGSRNRCSMGDIISVWGEKMVEEEGSETLMIFNIM